MSARYCIPEVVVTEGATAGISESETPIGSSTMDVIRDSPRIPIDGVKRQSERRAIALKLRGPRRRFLKRGGHRSTWQSPWAGSCVSGVVLVKSKRAVPQPYYGGSLRCPNTLPTKEPRSWFFACSNITVSPAMTFRTGILKSIVISTVRDCFCASTFANSSDLRFSLRGPSYL